jgi:hypothetical protein
MNQYLLRDENKVHSVIFINLLRGNVNFADLFLEA